MNASLRWSTFAAPSRFYRLAGWLVPWCWAVAIALALAGLWVGFGIAPSDFQQGDAYRIIFIHVPAASISMLLYMVMAFWAVIGWALNVRLASMLARAIAPTGALLALVGAVNVPIIYFSVRWWNTLHQGATISMTAAPKMAHTMLIAMLLMTIACWAYAFAVVFTRVRAIIIERERHTAWVAGLAVAGAGAGANGV